MALSIKNDDADRLARELAATTGETLTEAVLMALRERLQRERARGQAGILHRVRRLAAEVGDMAVLDRRPAEEIIGYDEHGLPG